MKLEEMARKVGESLGTSDWFTIDQDRINAFADCTEDHQFIHINPEMAKMTPFGGTIAHGFLTLSMMPTMMDNIGNKPETLMSVNYGFNKMRFIAPVKSGKRIRGHCKLLELVQKRPGQWQQTIEMTVEIEGEAKPCLQAEWIFQHFTAA